VNGLHTWQLEGQSGHKWIWAKALWSKGERMKALMTHLGTRLSWTIDSHLDGLRIGGDLYGIR